MEIITKFMDISVIVSIISPVIIGIIGFFLSRSFKKIDQLEGTIENLKEAINQLKIKQETLSSHYSFMENVVSSIQQNILELRNDIKELVKDINKK